MSNKEFYFGDEDYMAEYKGYRYVVQTGGSVRLYGKDGELIANYPNEIAMKKDVDSKILKKVQKTQIAAELKEMGIEVLDGEKVRRSDIRRYLSSLA